MKPKTYETMARQARIPIGISQEKAAALLYSRWGQWVPLPRLGTATGIYYVNSVIATLRKKGLVIENKKYNPGPPLDPQEVFSYYRLVDFKPRNDR